LSTGGAYPAEFQKIGCNALFSTNFLFLTG
jgi:hypothetical protein